MGGTRGHGWGLAICLGASIALNALSAVAMADRPTTSPKAALVQAQADETPDTGETSVDSKRIRGRHLPATDSPGLPLLWLPLVTAGGLVVITIGILALTRVANSKDEAWLAHVAAARKLRRRRPPPPPPPPSSRTPSRSESSERISTAWDVLGRKGRRRRENESRQS